MTDDTFDQRLAAWLARDATNRVPAHLGAILDATASARQRRPIVGPLGWRWAAAGVRPLAIAAVVILLAAMAVAGLGSGSLNGSPEPSRPAPAGELIVSFDGGLYLADPTTQGRRPLDDSAGSQYAVEVSPEGSRFAYLQTDDIVRGGDAAHVVIKVANRDGSELRRVSDLIVSGVLGVAWSPDGRRLAVLHRDPEQVDHLSIIDVEAGDALQAVPLPSGNFIGSTSFGFDVAWRGSGDGELLLNEARTPTGVPTGIIAIQPDGTGQRDVARFPFYYVALSADGHWLSYFNYLPEAPPVSYAETHLVSVVTGIDRVLSSGHGSLDQELVFAPDSASGIMVACVSFDECQLVEVALDDSTEPRPIGSIGGGTPKERSFLYSPDGTRLAVNGQGRQSVIVDLDNLSTTALPDSWRVLGWLAP
jgi:hypothetical protein